MRLRQSTLKVWKSCALQAKFQTIERLPGRQSGKASFGTIIHHCLEQYNNGLEIDSAVDLFKDLWKHPEKLGVEPEYWPKYTTYGGLREKGVEILRDYDEKVRWENRQILASEHRFLVPMGDHELEGTVDHVEIKKAGNGHRTLRIVDFKTSGKQPNRVDLRLDIQFTVYMFAAMQPEFWIGNGPGYPGLPGGEDTFEVIRKLPMRGVWYHLWTGKELDAGERDDGDFMRLYRFITEIEKSVSADVYVPNIGESCVWCPYTANCNIEIPDRDELEAEIL
jgi:hypothetical protein